MFRSKKALMVMLGVLIGLSLLVFAVIIINRIQLEKYRKKEKEAGLLFRQAQELRAQQKWVESLNMLEEIIARCPRFGDITEVRFLAGNTYLHQLRKWDEAGKHYESIIKDRRRSAKSNRLPDTLIELASIYRAQRKNKEAIKLLEEALRNYPSRVNKEGVYFQLQMLYEEIGERDKAKELYFKRIGKSHETKEG